MKKSLIALILLSGFIGCEKSNSPITVQNEQNNRRTQEPTGNHNVTATETTAEHLSFVLGKPFPATIIDEPEDIAEPDEIEQPKETVEPVVIEKPEETAETAEPVAIEKPEEVAEPNDTEKPEEVLAATPIRYISRKDGFRVLLPSDPTVMNLDATNNTHVRIYQTKAHDGLIQYNIFCHFFEKKFLTTESIRSYLDSYLPDRLVGIDEGQIVRKILTTFIGFDAKEFEYISAVGDTEFIYKGVVFLIDGDSISLTMVYPKQLPPDLVFDEFVESFELLPLEPILSPDYWVDKRLGIRFAPPADMSILDSERSRNGLIAMFANEVGHTIGILDATAAYPGITWSDINQKLSNMKNCGDGFYEKIIAGTKTKPPMVQLLRCARNEERIYLVQAYAPQKTYIRAVQQFRAAMKSLSFDH
ncbi:hypothetical protein ACFL5Z_03470 [Planctomycetota bacterium]